jgi:hypothetical protein
MVRSVAVSMALLVAVAAVAEAQRAHDRTGLWMGLGLGAGFARATCSVCGGRETGPAMQVRVGGTISQSILAGVEGTGWLQSGAAGDRSLLMLIALGILYPSSNHGFHLEAGIGGYRYVEADTANELSTEGLALHLGARYDLRITRRVSLSPFATVMASSFGNPTRLDKSSGTRLPLLSDMTVRYIQLGVSATIH